MIPSCTFLRPASFVDALQLLDKHPKAVLLAGGTDVIPGMMQNDVRFASAETLIDIHHLPELRTIHESSGGLFVGSAVTFSEVVKHNLIQNHYPLLSAAASTIGSVQIRNRATFAGNFINNAACADSVPPLLAYNAVVFCRSLNSAREIPLSEFLLSPNQTALKPGEIVTGILLPPLSENYRGQFLKLGRRRGIAISRITLAILLKQNQTQIEDIRIASGAVTPIGTRFFELEKSVINKTISDTLCKELAGSLGEAVLETTGLRWSSPYKLPVVQQMCYSLLRELARQQ
jgi:xanthine dehydrogenase FAD-binding subunit